MQATPNPQPVNPILYIDQIPKKDHGEFWLPLESKSLQYMLIFKILNEIRAHDPTTLTAEACRTQLAKLSAYVDTMDFHRYDPSSIPVPIESDPFADIQNA